MENEDYISIFSKVLTRTDSGEIRSVDGPELLCYGISPGDLPLWQEFIRIGDDVSIHKILTAKKCYLLTHVIGDPTNPFIMLMKNNEAHYGNIALHNRIANSHDESILKLEHPTQKQSELLLGNQKGTDYLLRYYELKQEKAEKDPGKRAQKIAEIEKAICAKDIEDKTPLLLACKTANQKYAMRLINLDMNNKTIDLSDKIEKRTPLHIACILGLEDVAQELKKRGANQHLTDKYAHTPFYYLTCSEVEKKHNIQQVFESVNFFFGRYFKKENADKVINTLLERRITTR